MARKASLSSDVLFFSLWHGKVNPSYLHDQEAKDDTRDDEGQEGDHQEANPVHPEQDAVVPQS